MDAPAATAEYQWKGLVTNKESLKFTCSELPFVVIFSLKAVAIANY